MKGLDKLGFVNPTPVQAASIAPLLAGHDAVVQAPTGTGKTAAFGIPVIERIDPANNQIQAVILCPTRELATQTAAVLKQLTAFSQSLRIQCLYGGEPIYRQITALKRHPQIIVATPGRMKDHIERRTVRLAHVACVVLDEADRMLDMGFRQDIDDILSAMPAERQTVLFSATLSKEVKKIAATYQHEAEQISIAQDTSTVERVEQFYAEIRGRAKTPALIQLLGDKQFKLSLVFVSTKAMADELARQLTSEGHAAEAIHGDLHQSQRNRVMQRYRDGKVRILVATDVAARGIDVNGIDAVINYDIPTDADSYVHRIGRTGRADKCGVAYTFIYPRERAMLQQIMLRIQANILPFEAQAGVMPRSWSPAEKKRSVSHSAGRRAGGTSRKQGPRYASAGL